MNEICEQCGCVVTEDNFGSYHNGDDYCLCDKCNSSPAEVCEVSYFGDNHSH